MMREESEWEEIDERGERAAWRLMREESDA